MCPTGEEKKKRHKGQWRKERVQKIKAFKAFCFSFNMEVVCADDVMIDKDAPQLLSEPDCSRYAGLFPKLLNGLGPKWTCRANPLC